MAVHSPWIVCTFIVYNSIVNQYRQRRVHVMFLNSHSSDSSTEMSNILHFYYIVLSYGTACPGPPESPTAVNDVSPHVDLSWSRPSAAGAWMYMYEVSWTNGSNIVPRQTSTTAQIPGLQAETSYTVVITAYPISNLCPDQSTTFTFTTSQS